MALFFLKYLMTLLSEQIWFNHADLDNYISPAIGTSEATV